MKVELNIPLEKNQKIYYPDYKTNSVCEMILTNVVLEGFTVYAVGSIGTNQDHRVLIPEIKETAEEVCEHMVKKYLAGIRLKNCKQKETVGPAFLSHISITNEGRGVTAAAPLSLGQVMGVRDEYCQGGPYKNVDTPTRE